MKLTEEWEVKENLPVIADSASKFDRGRLLLIAGSAGMAGACVMAARAALRAGTGYLTVFLPESIYQVVTMQVPEAVCITYREYAPDEMLRKLLSALRGKDAVVIGPGLSDCAGPLCDIVFSEYTGKLLLDAGALSYLAKTGPVSFSSQDVCMTPHSGEAGRLLRRSHKDIDSDREEAVQTLSRTYHAAVLLKGSGTLVYANGQELRMNPTGNAGLARAGSGDVLSGITGSLLAQGEGCYAALFSGAFLHGSAADLGIRRFGMRSLLPTDLVDLLPEVFRELENPVLK